MRSFKYDSPARGTISVHRCASRKREREREREKERVQKVSRERRPSECMRRPENLHALKIRPERFSPSPASGGEPRRVFIDIRDTGVRAPLYSMSAGIPRRNPRSEPSRGNAISRYSNKTLARRQTRRGRNFDVRLASERRCGKFRASGSARTSSLRRASSRACRYAGMQREGEEETTRPQPRTRRQFRSRSRTRMCIFNERRLCR